jgi:cell wall-associated NlpC family hydrolase
MNKKQKTILVLTTIGALITTFFILNKNKKTITLGKASIIDRVINTGKTLIGTPYVWGGCTPGGFDCSGFIQYIFAQNGIVLPRTTTGYSLHYLTAAQ